MTSSAVTGNAVGETRRRIEPEGDVAPRIVGLDRARQQTVERERLVIAARHQAFDHVAADRLHGEALDDEGIEAVEGSKHALHQPAALRRIGIGIGQHGKAVRHCRRAVHGDGMSRFRRRGGEARNRERSTQNGAGSQGDTGVADGVHRREWNSRDSKRRMGECSTAIPLRLSAGGDRPTASYHRGRSARFIRPAKWAISGSRRRVVSRCCRNLRRMTVQWGTTRLAGAAKSPVDTRSTRHPSQIRSICARQH